MAVAAKVIVLTTATTTIKIMRVVHAVSAWYVPSTHIQQTKTRHSVLATPEDTDTTGKRVISNVEDTTGISSKADTSSTVTTMGSVEVTSSMEDITGMFRKAVRDIAAATTVSSEVVTSSSVEDIATAIASQAAISSERASTDVETHNMAVIRNVSIRAITIRMLNTA